MNAPFFAGPGLDRADPLRARPDSIDELRGNGQAKALAWDCGMPALDPCGRLHWTCCTGEEPLFLGFDGDGSACFASLPETPGGDDYRARFALLAQLDGAEAPLFAAALSLANWHCRHTFCSVCGERSEFERGGWSRRCPSCGASHFPRVDPVVIMLAEHDGRLLLGRQPQYPQGRYSALAGFVEPGETIEAAVARELKEEAGIDVADVRYLASQPWPFPNSLMIGCSARALGDKLEIDRDELDDAAWFTREEVRSALAGEDEPPFLPPPPFAIARTLIEHWAASA